MSRTVIVIAGIVGGAIVGLLLVGSIALFVTQKRRARKNKQADLEHGLEILPKTPEQAQAGVRTNTMGSRLERIEFGH
jgi:hypothetical protein